jgi:hypothetical protein
MNMETNKTIGYVVVYKYDTHSGGKRGCPVTSHGHFKVYATREAANRRRYTVGKFFTRVVPVNCNLGFGN